MNACIHLCECFATYECTVRTSCWSQRTFPLDLFALIWPGWCNYLFHLDHSVVTMSSEEHRQLVEKLSGVLGPDDLVKVLVFLDKNNSSTNCKKTLLLLLDKDEVFAKYTQELAKDIGTAENDGFLGFMKTLYKHLMTPSEKSRPAGEGQSWDPDRLCDGIVSKTFAEAGMSRTWEVIPVGTRGRILKYVPRLIANYEIMQTVQECSGKVASVVLAAAYLTKEAIRAIRQWWKGEISGKRCAKKVVDATVTTASGIGGGVVGATVGSAFGPLGTLAGSTLGGLIASNLANFICDRLTQAIFDIPRSEQLENAYRFLCVSHTASNDEVNQRFRDLCRKYHPDKGGKEEDFITLQCHMEVIRNARNEMWGEENKRHQLLDHVHCWLHLVRSCTFGQQDLLHGN